MCVCVCACGWVGVCKICIVNILADTQQQYITGDTCRWQMSIVHGDPHLFMRYVFLMYVLYMHVCTWHAVIFHSPPGISMVVSRAQVMDRGSAAGCALCLLF